MCSAFPFPLRALDMGNSSSSSSSVMNRSSSLTWSNCAFAFEVPFVSATTVSPSGLNAGSSSNGSAGASGRILSSTAEASGETECGMIDGFIRLLCGNQTEDVAAMSLAHGEDAFCRVQVHIPLTVSVKLVSNPSLMGSNELRLLDWSSMPGLFLAV